MKLLQLLLVLLLFSGCATPSPETASKNSSKEDPRVVIDPVLHGIVRVRGIVEIPSPNGAMQFQANVENLGAKAITIVYQVDWLDADGATMGIQMDEPPCTLFRKEVHPIAITSPAASARSFRITIRPRTK